MGICGVAVSLIVFGAVLRDLFFFFSFSRLFALTPRHGLCMHSSISMTEKRVCKK